MRLWPLTSGDGHFSLFSVSDEDSRALLLHGSTAPRLHAGDYAEMCTADHTHFEACDDKLIRMRIRVRSCNLIFVSLSIFHRLHGFVSYYHMCELHSGSLCVLLTHTETREW